MTENYTKKPIKMLSPKVDIIFKLLFGDNRNVEILTNFLQDVLSLPKEEYDSVAIVDPTLKKEDPEDKFSIVDVKLTTKTGKIVHIEIQLIDQDSMPERVVYYNAKMLVSQLKSGDPYSSLQKTISIIIVDFDMIDNSKYHNVFQLYEKNTGIRFSDIVEINTLEMSKALKSPDDTSKCDWMMFLKAESEEEFEMIAEKNPRIRGAVAELKKLSESEANQMIYEARQKAITDKESQIRTAENKGRLEGRLEGKIEGKIESAAGVVSMFGASITQALESVGLPEDYRERLLAYLNERNISYSDKTSLK